MNKANWRARARGPRPPPRLSEDASGGHTKDCRNARTFSAGCLDNRCRGWRTTTSVAFGGPCESSARWRRFYVSFRTIETWWYDYTSRGYQGLTGKSARTDAGKSRSAEGKSIVTHLCVLIDDHSRLIPFKNLRGGPLPARPQGRTALRSHPHGSRGSLA